MGVKQADRDGFNAVRGELGELFPDPAFVRRAEDAALRIEAFLDLANAVIQVFRFADAQVEQARSVLAGDAEDVAESARGEERGPRPLAFQQGVGAPGGAEADGDRAGRLVRAQSHQPADAKNGSLLGAGQGVTSSRRRGSGERSFQRE